jgi:hypothetical protein
VLLMDADVLYDERILNAPVAGESVNRLLIDRAAFHADRRGLYRQRPREPASRRGGARPAA